MYFLLELYLVNAQESLYDLFRSKADVFVTIEDSARYMHAWATITMSVKCPMDFYKYPRDRHNCKFLIGAMHYDETQSIYKTKVNLSLYNHVPAVALPTD